MCICTYTYKIEYSENEDTYIIKISNTDKVLY